MKAVGVTGPDFMPRRFDVGEPIAAPGGVVVDVMAASVNDFDRAAVSRAPHRSDSSARSRAARSRLRGQGCRRRR